MLKGSVTTLAALSVTAWVMVKFFGDPDEFGMVGCSLWVLGGLVIACLLLGMVGFLGRK